MRNLLTSRLVSAAGRWSVGNFARCFVALSVLLFAAFANAEIKVVELSGDGKSIGTRHGEAVGAEIRLLLEKYLGPSLKDETTKMKALVGAALFRNHLSPEHKEEIAAIESALKITNGEVMLGNCFLDLLSSVGCSTVTLPSTAAPDGVPRFGRNLDFPSLDVADKHSVLFIVRPKDRYAFAAVSWPGLIGVLSGMNEHGLTIANMEVHRPARLPAAMPYAILYRTVLEKCRTVEEAIALLHNTPRQSANNLMLMDAAGNRALAEITPDKVVIRRTSDDSALISTNYHCGEDHGTSGRCRRFDFLKKESAVNFGKIGVPEIQEMLRGVHQGAQTMQSMIFEPSTRVLYVAVGSESHKLPMQRIELGKYFAPR